MIGKVLAGLAVVAAVPAGFAVLLIGPQAASQSANVGAACQMALGMPPRGDSTVEQLGGPQAAAIAATLTQARTDPVSGAVTAPVVAAQDLTGPRAYGFVTTLNTLDNWRSLPAEATGRWALDPTTAAPPAGAVALAVLPIAQTDAVRVDEQANTAWGRGCAAVIGRATAITVHPANGHQRPDVAALAAAQGQTMSNLALLHLVNPNAVNDDPRQFWLNYQASPSPSAGDVVVYDFTAGGPAHFGIAVDDRQHMLTTGSAAGGQVQLWPIPANCAAMSADVDSDDPQKGTSS